MLQIYLIKLIKTNILSCICLIISVIPLVSFVEFIIFCWVLFHVGRVVDLYCPDPEDIPCFPENESLSIVVHFLYSVVFC